MDKYRHCLQVKLLNTQKIKESLLICINQYCFNFISLIDYFWPFSCPNNSRCVPIPEEVQNVYCRVAVKLSELLDYTFLALTSTLEVTVFCR